MLHSIVEGKHKFSILYQHLRWSSFLLESYKNWQNKANVKAMNNLKKNRNSTRKMHYIVVCV
jgi:hypothetical protein